MQEHIRCARKRTIDLAFYCPTCIAGPQLIDMLLDRRTRHPITNRGPRDLKKDALAAVLNGWKPCQFCCEGLPFDLHI